MMLGILGFIELVADVSDPVVKVLVLTSLASVAGLGMGYYDAQAKTRALNAEERHRESERYSRELEQYETIVETVDDGIYAVDEDNNCSALSRFRQSDPGICRFGRTTGDDQHPPR